MSHSDPTTIAFFFQSDASSAGWVIVMCVVILLAAVLDYERRKARKAVEAARLAYQEALTVLKTRPTDPGLRQRALEVGRIYSNLTRNKKGITVFDEVALSNDISAACAGATAYNFQSAPQAPRQTVESRLRQLDQLRTQGLITEEEYSARRNTVLNEI